MFNLSDEIIDQYPQLANIDIGLNEIFIASMVNRLPFISTEKKDLLFLYLVHSDFLIHSIYLLLFIIVLAVSIFLLFKIKKLLRIKKKLKSEVSNQIILELRPPSKIQKASINTTELFNVLHSIAGKNTCYSLEIVATKKEGIRYIIHVPEKDSDIVQKTLYSYFPEIKIKEIDDYLPNFVDDLSTQDCDLQEYNQTNIFPYPLRNQDKLNLQDPISYVASMMGKLEKDELTVLQYVICPAKEKITKTQSELLDLAVNDGDIFKGLDNLYKNTLSQSIWIWIKRILLFIIFRWFYVGFCLLRLYLDKKQEKIVKTEGQKQLISQIKTKLEEPLYEVSIRSFLRIHNPEIRSQKQRSLSASFSSFKNSCQSIKPIKNLGIHKLSLMKKVILYALKARSQSGSIVSILSSSELSNLYHFPNSQSTQIEDLAKSHSKDLPVPLSLKNNKKLDVVFGKNNYANSNVDIGLTDEDRSRHAYILGQTGSGKSTIIYHMAKDDINKNRGVAVIDPHGDLAEDLLSCVPEKRIDDCVYLNPSDLKYPIGINLLEFDSKLKDEELEQEKELVCEGVISVFRRIFSNDEQTNAHRIEYILRNAIYTAFTIPNATIFTVYELLNNPKYRKQAIKNVTDENLKIFWKNEFGKAGNYQVVKMVSGVTAKIGRFLFSPSAKRILEQSKSTINFDQILESGKILICNLAEGKLGEDTSQLLGTTIIAKLQQSAMRRERKSGSKRKPYYIFVDEFQNFATSSFTKLLSGGRKFGLRLTIAEQSTAQQEDKNVVNVILANTGTVICFRTASPVDEKLMSDQFKPYISKEDISNLPRYKFFMKLGAVEPEEPFSGQTLPIIYDKDSDVFDKIIKSSRKNYAKLYQKPKSKTVIKKPKKRKKVKKITSKNKDIRTLV